MKRIKKFAAALLTAIMMMTMTVTAYAAGGTHTLTVNAKGGQDLNGQTINLYKLFDVTESNNDGTTNYAYTVNTATGYKDALEEVLHVKGLNLTDAEIAERVANLGEDNNQNVQDFANDFTKKALTASPKLVATKSEGPINGSESVKSKDITGLETGYYLVYVTGGKEIQSSLVLVDKDQNITLKTEAPSITKEANKTTVNIGDVVTYTVTGKIPDTTGYDSYVYKIHDTLSNGLDFVNDANGAALGTDATAVKVTVAFKDAADATTAPTEATLDTVNKRKMSLDLSAWVRNNQTNKGKEFTVTYYAKVNKDAIVTEKNSATLEYGNQPSETTTTTPSEAKTPTYPLDINKIKKGSEEKLAGAKFRLYRDENDADAGQNPIAVSGSNGKYVVTPNSGEFDLVSVNSVVGILDNKDYNLQVNGLAAGTYYLVETKAPDGFNKLTDPIKVTITKSTDTDEENWILSKGEEKQEPRVITVENSTGSILPSTGGTGVIVFAGVAILLVFGVAVSFIRDKRKAC